MYHSERAIGNRKKGIGIIPDHNVCPRYADRHLYGKFEFYIYFTVYHAVQSDLLLQNHLPGDGILSKV